MSPLTQKPSQSKSANYSLAGTLGWFFVVALSFVLLLALLAGPHFLGHHLKAGDVAEQDLIAPAHTKVVDEVKLKSCEKSRGMRFCLFKARPTQSPGNFGASLPALR